MARSQQDCSLRYNLSALSSPSCSEIPLRIVLFREETLLYEDRTFNASFSRGVAPPLDVIVLLRLPLMCSGTGGAGAPRRLEIPPEWGRIVAPRLRLLEDRG